MGSNYYSLKKCKTCNWWEPFAGACCNGDSENRADFMCGDDSCDQWERNIHFGCGGTMEAREYNGVVEHYCYGCLFTVLIDGKPIEETRNFFEGDFEK